MGYVLTRYKLDTFFKTVLYFFAVILPLTGKNERVDKSRPIEEASHSGVVENSFPNP